MRIDRYSVYIYTGMLKITCSSKVSFKLFFPISSLFVLDFRSEFLCESNLFILEHDMIDPEFGVFFVSKFHFFLSGQICTFKDVFILKVRDTIFKIVSVALTLHF